jgi:hypothetical protein
MGRCSCRSAPWDFSPELLNEIEISLVSILAREERHLLHPVLRERHVALVFHLDQLPWHEDPGKSAEVAVDILAASIDPADDEGDVAWVMVALKLLESPRIGSRFGRSWFVRLLRARAEDLAVSPCVEAIASYLIAAYEMLLRREHEVWIWVQTAASMTDFEERPGLSLAMHVRAARLVQPVLQRATQSIREVTL